MKVDLVLITYKVGFADSRSCFAVKFKGRYIPIEIHKEQSISNEILREEEVFL